ncbi:MAG: hypothetical protein V1902_00490 [Candidatus Falkowbacteria bacterium]
MDEHEKEVLERSQAPPKKRRQDIFGNVAIFVTPHAIQEFIKDVNTLPKNPAAVIEKLLRAAKIIGRTPQDKQNNVWRFRSGCFDFIVAMDRQIRDRLVVITCWQRRHKTSRLRSRDARAKEKQLLRKKLKDMNLR